MARRASPPGDTSALSDLLARVFRSHGLEKDYFKWMMFSLWRQSVGTKIAQQAQPKKLFRGILTLEVSSSVWVQQLTFMKRELMDRINREAAQWLEEHRLRNHQQIPLGFETITDIRFVLGNPTELNPEKSSVVETPAPQNFYFSEEEQKRAAQLTQDIADAELRELLTRAYLKGRS